MQDRIDQIRRGRAEGKVLQRQHESEMARRQTFKNQLAQQGGLHLDRIHFLSPIAKYAIAGMVHTVETGGGARDKVISQSTRKDRMTYLRPGHWEQTYVPGWNVSYGPGPHNAARIIAVTPNLHVLGVSMDLLKVPTDPQEAAALFPDEHIQNSAARIIANTPDRNNQPLQWRPHPNFPAPAGAQ